MPHTVARFGGTFALLLAATSCSAGSDPTATNKASPSATTATPTPTTSISSLHIEAMRALGADGIVLAGRPEPSSQLQVFLCPGLDELTACRDISPSGLSRGEYVDDLAPGGSHTLWMLTIDVDQQAAVLRVSRDSGRTWTAHPAPARGVAAGSSSTVQVLNDHQALLTTYWANGPLARLYRTDDAGATWKSLGDVSLDS